METENQKELTTDPEVRIVLVTFPDPEVARQIGTHLIESQVAACINLVPGVESIYQWEGKVTSDREVLGVIKTTIFKVNELERMLHEKHPYEVPEFLVIKPDSGSESYLNWVSDSCSEKVKKPK